MFNIFWRKFYRLVRIFRTKKKKTVFLICALILFGLQRLFQKVSNKMFDNIFVNQKICDIRTEEEYKKIDFNFTWTRESRFWDNQFEQRYSEKQQFPLKVFLLPHSHNDPGWKQTAEQYYDYQTKTVLNHAVEKMTIHKNMTFAWTEMFFLSKWWKTSSAEEKAKLQNLIAEKRFEVLTAGWVMTDEATVHIYSMLDQLIEGQQWLWQTLGIKPTSSWSLDPFGHSGTQAYLLKASGINAMAIMRIHRAWKVHFARQRGGDFYWHQSWDPSSSHDILTHVFPYDLYSTRDSCGPNRPICLQFYFGTPNGFSTDYTQVVVSINQDNVEERAKLLMEQYGKTGSLYPHNVIVVPLGEDFTLMYNEEWDNQYGNYSLLLEHINSNPDKYNNAEINFGTLTDYFEEVAKREKTITQPLKTLSGDFFVYSDDRAKINNEQCYWSGYFTTRPYMKWLARQAENNLRSAEILYTLALNKARQNFDQIKVNAFEQIYWKMVTARRNLALFQHHDAITGTSTEHVMKSYEKDLQESITSSQTVHKSIFQHSLDKQGTPQNDSAKFDLGLDPLVSLPAEGKAEYLTVFNSLTRQKDESISFLVETSKYQTICISDKNNYLLKHQVSPYFNSAKFRPDANFLSVTFVAQLSPLSITSFKIITCTSSNSNTLVRCLNCLEDITAKPFSKKLLKSTHDQISIDSSRHVLTFDTESQMLSQVHDRASGKSERLQLQLGLYPTLTSENGAYIFMTDPSKIASVNSMDIAEIIVIEGPVFSEVTTMFGEEDSSTFRTSIRVYHEGKFDGIQVENFLDFGPAGITDLDISFGINTDIRNLDDRGKPYFFTDMNGFQMQKRVQVDGVDLEGHFYPVTSMAYLEDESLRLSLVVDHSLAVASLEEGSLKLILDRRASRDDGRGLEQSLRDTRPMTHKYRILLETRSSPPNVKSMLSLPSESAQQTSNQLNYPSLVYSDSAKTEEENLAREHNFVSDQVPCNLHLVNLRTTSQPTIDLPSSSALLILQHQATDSAIQLKSGCERGSHLDFKDLSIKKLTKTSLTGLSDLGSLESLKHFIPEPVALGTVIVDF